MGTFTVTIEIGDPQGERWEPLEALVDTGSTYTWVDGELLHQLGVVSIGQAPFEIADGSIVYRDIGQTEVRYGGRARTTIVVFGDPGSSPLLGAYTLEGFLLAVDPIGRKLVPVVGLAKGLRA